MPVKDEPVEKGFHMYWIDSNVSLVLQQSLEEQSVQAEVHAEVHIVEIHTDQFQGNFCL